MNMRIKQQKAQNFSVYTVLGSSQIKDRSLLGKFKLIIDKLSKYFNDSDKAREITDFIYSDRKNDTKIYLKKIN
jgi:hypothetical protein